MEPIFVKRRLRLDDLSWLLLFGGMMLVSPYREPAEMASLAILAGFQILEPRLALLHGPRGTLVSIGIKLGLGLLLIQTTGGLNSGYYLILLLPLVSAATTYGVAGTILVTLLTSLVYLSLLFFVDWNRYTIEPYDLRLLLLRLVFLALVGYFAHRMAEGKREEAKKHQEMAEQLAAANLSLREAEAAVRRSERLAALGQMSAGLAHELRNPLGTMRVSAEMLARSVSAENAVASEMAGFIATEVDRLNSLITRFLDFARPLQLRLQTGELGEILDHAIGQLKRHEPALDVAIYRNDSPDIRPFAMDPELMERVFYNLLLNAAQASPPGGAITVKTRPVDGAVEITVIDRGAGIDPKHMENIFNPFFTTKQKGVGLGLAIVTKIVDEHGGRLAVESEPGRGSIFRVFLPVKSL